MTASIKTVKIDLGLWRTIPSKAGLSSNKANGIVLLWLMISGAAALLPEDWVSSSDGNWLSNMSHCFTNEASVDGTPQSICQQLRAVHDCCRAEYGEIAGDYLSELKNMLVDAVLQTRDKYCDGGKSMKSAYSHQPWNCMSEVTTLFNQCLIELISPKKIHFKTFSYVEFSSTPHNNASSTRS
ncbi:uncharacterized protein LOC115258399 isoform X2 [Aedes albopictus]|uniref:Uncharacterized protein n=1 Tax=Aedes albopictus TaxID=7160 RepID=A0ABM1XM85_AEDAL